MFIGLGSNFFNNALFSLPLNNLYIEFEFVPAYIKLIPVFFSLFGAGLSIYFYLFFNELMYKIKLRFIYIYYFLIKKWYFDIIVNSFIVPLFLKFAYEVSFNSFDRGIFELIGPFGFSKIFNYFSIRFSRLQTGFIYHYAFVFVLGLILFISLVLIQNTYDYLILFLIIIFMPIYYNFIMSNTKGLQ